MTSTSENRRVIANGVFQTLLVAFFFYGYGAPVFDPVRPAFLDRPLYEYRVAVHTISNGHEIGLEKPLIDVFSPVQDAIRTVLSPAQKDRKPKN